jgi:hypothetical protein
MPTIFWISSFRVMIRTNDHPPPHVHVLGPDGRAKIHFDCENGTIDLVSHEGMTRSDLRRILQELEARIEVLCNEWRAIHGQI